MSGDPQYAKPFAWWGPAWETPAPRGIAALLRDETIDSWSAANLWAALARRRSLAVIAGPSGAGKTTLLTALLDFLPPETRRIYVRGCFETFAFLADPVVVPARSALLVNEISPHLPVYLWGPVVERLLVAADRGFMVLATAHGESPTELIGTLTGSPLRIPPARMAALEFIVALEKSAASASGRRVGGMWRLSRTRDGVSIAAAPPHDISHEEPQPSDWFPEQELRQRRRLLIDLRDGRIDKLPALDAQPEAGA